MMSDKIKTISFRKGSLIDWGVEDTKLNLEELQTGALLRIADAMETVAQKQERLIKQKEFYRDCYLRQKKHSIRLESEIKGLKVTRSRFKNHRDKLNAECDRLEAELAKRNKIIQELQNTIEHLQKHR